MTSPDERPTLRIGELSRRVGVSDHLLRAWERRYGLLRPVRSAGGFRLYSQKDLERVQRMQQYLAEGLSPAQAAQTAIAGELPSGTNAGHRDGPAQTADALTRAMDEFDEAAAQAAIDQLFSTLTVETVLRQVLIPYLREL